MNDLKHTVEDYKLFEAIADIAYIAGKLGYASEDSRADMADFINWAKHFENLHEETDWDQEDYQEAIAVFTEHKLKSALLAVS